MDEEAHSVLERSRRDLLPQVSFSEVGVKFVSGRYVRMLR